ncbi:hypothetical protein Tco_0801609 [Tanacetum coccineum]|uniref:GAG-pre-integrase domain-containing protein n=1 Tax=Tanacetum coccineum TaxID=301880 RepID=A0ABQ4ZZC4_9ASTR
MILDSLLNGPLVWPTVVQVDGTTKKKTYAELSATEKLQADCDLKATNIVLQSLPPDVYAIVNHHKVSTIVVLDLSKRFAQLINNMNVINMSIRPVQVNTKFLNSLPPEWSKFMMDMKLERDLHTTNYDQLFPSTNNQLRTSSNPRNQATVQDDRVTVQQVQGRQGQVYAGTGYKGNATSSGGNNKAGQARAFKEKAMLAEALESGQILDEEQLAFLADPGIPDGQAAQTTMQNNDAFQTEDLDAYDSDCDDVANAKAVLMANLSNYGYDVISEVPHSDSYHNDMDNQSVHTIQDFEQTPFVDFSDNEITSDSNIISYFQYLHETQQAAIQDTNANQEKNNESVTAELERYKERVKFFEQRLNIGLSTHEKMIDSQMDDMIKEKLALKQQINSHEQNLSNQIKEKEYLLQTFTVFKNESKEKESKYMENEIDLEKKIKELDNIKAQRIKPTLYDGSVISSQHAASPVIDDEETLILEEDIFNVFDRDLLNEITEVQTIFNQLEVAVQQCSLDKQCFEIVKKELFLEYDRILQHIMSQDVLLSVMNSTTLNGESVNVEMQNSKPYDKCFDLDAELLKSKNLYNELLKSYSQLEKHCISLELSIQLNQEIFQKDKSCDNQKALEFLEYFKNNKLKAQLQAKDTTIYKLKEHIKSMRENDKEKKVKQDMNEIATINIDLEHSVTKLLSENERKEIVENAAQIPIATTIVPGMLKLDLDPLAPRLFSGCYKHMTRNRSQLMIFVSKFLGTVRFKNDQIAKIMGYGDYQLGNKNTYFIRNLEGIDLLSGSRDTNLYTISLDDMLKTSPICLLSKALKTKSWLWHRRLSHLNFACALGKRKKSSHQPKAEDTNQEKLYLLHMDLCGPMRMESINGKKYILVIVDDYS